MTIAYLQFVDVKENRAKAFGEWLRQKRKERHLTMEELGRKVGLSKQYLSVLERAEPHALTGKPVTPGIDNVDRIAAALEVDSGEARRMAGYASDDEDEGLYSGLNKLSPEQQRLAKRHIKALIDSMVEVADPDFNYIDDD